MCTRVKFMWMDTAVIYGSAKLSNHHYDNSLEKTQSGAHDDISFLLAS